ncbi:ATP-binding cassette domain-containing protein [Promineifilum sp.]|uniref:ATP-binding cassette domain-containing protein n=1 Tax=Promineifilum sp. TaxID=2664178 RepID=UPI0035B123C1
MLPDALRMGTDSRVHPAHTAGAPDRSNGAAKSGAVASPRALHDETVAPGDIYHLTGLTKVYNDRTVLDIPDLTIRRGEVLALVGPSGSGKSTLLRLLNFLEPPSAGHLSFDGRPAGSDPPLAERRRVTAVFQRPALLHRSVAANIGYGLRLRGERLPAAQLNAWLDRLGLAHLARQSAPKLSAGESQRVALVRALAIRPDVLLLDEPTANLDPYNVGLIERLVAEEHAATGMTVIWVTHDIFQARRVADRVAFLLGGRVVELSDVETFFNAPASPQAAAFLRGELVY